MPVQVVVAGSGDDLYVQRLQSQVASAGLGDRVHFVGHVGGSLKFSLCEAADICVLPTSQENFGFVQFEALACGTPVMTTTLVDTWREIDDSGGGVAVEQNADAVIEGLQPLLADPTKREEMGRLGRAWVLENLATDRIAERRDAMYTDAAFGY